MVDEATVENILFGSSGEEHMATVHKVIGMLPSLGISLRPQVLSPRNLPHFLPHFLPHSAPWPRCFRPGPRGSRHRRGGARSFGVVPRHPRHPVNGRSGVAIVGEGHLPCWG